MVLNCFDAFCWLVVNNYIIAWKWVLRELWNDPRITTVIGKPIRILILRVLRRNQGAKMVSPEARGSNRYGGTWLKLERLGTIGSWHEQEPPWKMAISFHHSFLNMHNCLKHINTKSGQLWYVAWKTVAIFPNQTVGFKGQHPSLMLGYNHHQPIIHHGMNGLDYMPAAPTPLFHYRNGMTKSKTTKLIKLILDFGCPLMSFSFNWLNFLRVVGHVSSHPNNPFHDRFRLAYGLFGAAGPHCELRLHQGRGTVFFDKISKSLVIVGIRNQVFVSSQIKKHALLGS